VTRSGQQDPAPSTQQPGDSPGIVGEVGQVVDEARILRQEDRYHACAQTGALEPHVPIRGILDRIDPPLLQVPHHLLPPAVDEGASHPVAPHRGDARKTNDSGPAQQPRQDRLRLVVTCVADRDARGSLGPSELAQDCVARDPGGCLEGRRGHPHGQGPEGQAEGVSQLPDGSHVLGRVGSEPVVHGGHDERDPEAPR